MPTQLRAICGAHPCDPRFQPKKSTLSPRRRQNAKIRQDPGRARLCRKCTDLRHVPQPRVTCVRSSRACEHGEEGLRWWHCRAHEITTAEHVPAEMSCRIVIRTMFSHVISGSELRVDHITTQTKVVRPFLPIHQFHQRRPASTRLSTMCGLEDSQLTNQQCLCTSDECFQFVSKREREVWWSAARRLLLSYLATLLNAHHCPRYRTFRVLNPRTRIGLRAHCDR